MFSSPSPSIYLININPILATNDIFSQLLFNYKNLLNLEQTIGIH